MITWASCPANMLPTLMYNLVANAASVCFPSMVKMEKDYNIINVNLRQQKRGSKMGK